MEPTKTMTPPPGPATYKVSNFPSFFILQEFQALSPTDATSGSVPSKKCKIIQEKEVNTSNYFCEPSILLIVITADY